MDAGRAVLLGHLLVSLPVILIIVGVGILVHFVLGLAWAIAFLIGVPVGRLWWSVSAPRWRLWATGKGADPQELQQFAQRSGLLWPENSIMTRTEIPSRRGRRPGG
jgi:polyferredoxin